MHRPPGRTYLGDACVTLYDSERDLGSFTETTNYILHARPLKALRRSHGGFRRTLSSRPAAARDTHSARARPLSRAAGGDRPRHPRPTLRARLRRAVWPAAEVEDGEPPQRFSGAKRSWTCAHMRGA